MSELLSSYALERQFGSLEFKVLQQDEGGRIISNKVEETGEVIELSQVVFRPEGLQAFPEIHRAIIEGTPIGKAFTEAGVLAHRDIHASYRYDHRSLPAIFAERFGTGESPTVIDLSLMIEPDGIPYADILEVFNPNVRSWENLAGGDMGEAIADRLNIFGAELAALTDTA